RWRACQFGGASVQFCRGGRDPDRRGDANPRRGCGNERIPATAIAEGILAAGPRLPYSGCAKFFIMSPKPRALLLISIRTWIATAVALCFLADAGAQDLLDAMTDKLAYTRDDGKVQAVLSVVSDLTLYA